MITFASSVHQNRPFFVAWLDGVKVGHISQQLDGEWYARLSDEGSGHYANSEEAAKGIFLKRFSKGQTNVLSDLSKDVKGFISDNRQIIYWMALIFLLDHFFFQGAFRERLKGMAEKMIGKVEKQIEAK